jgi:hypothetical protein
VELDHTSKTVVFTTLLAFELVATLLKDESVGAVRRRTPAHICLL